MVKKMIALTALVVMLMSIATYSFAQCKMNNVAKGEQGGCCGCCCCKCVQVDNVK